MIIFYRESLTNLNFVRTYKLSQKIVPFKLSRVYIAIVLIHITLPLYRKNKHFRFSIQRTLRKVNRQDTMACILKLFGVYKAIALTSQVNEVKSIQD